MKKTLIRLILDYPFFGSLALSVGMEKDYSIPTLCTNGKIIRYNPDFTNTLSSMVKLLAHLHELGHIILGHSFRRNERNKYLWNVACDHAVNLMLKQVLNIPIPATWHCDERYSGWSAEQIYDDLHDTFNQEVNKLSDEMFSPQGDQDQDQNQDTDTENKDQDTENQDQSQDTDTDTENQDQSQDTDTDTENQDQSQDTDTDTENQDQNQDTDTEDEDNSNQNGQDDNFEDVDNSNQNGQDDNSDSEDIDSLEDGPGQNKPEPESKELKELKELVNRSIQSGMVEDAPDGEKIEHIQTKVLMSDWVTGGKMAGNEDGGMLREVLEEMTSTEVSWKHVLTRFVNRACESSYNWMRPNSRYSLGNVIMPSLKSNNSIILAVAFDTSGSIDDEQLEKFIAEFKNLISSIEYKELHMISCDTKIYNPKKFTKSEQVEYVPVGGGGSYAFPVWDYYREQNIIPDALVYFTDLAIWDEGWGNDPGYPILWVDWDGCSFYNDIPFGEKVLMKKTVF